MRIGLRVTFNDLRRQTPRKLCCALLAVGLALPPAALAQTAPAPLPTLTPELKGRRVEDVRILGNTTVSSAIIRNLIRTRVGEKFDPATAQEDYQRVFELKKFANVQAAAEPTADGGVIVVFTVTEQKLINSIVFKGNVHVDADALRTAIGLKVGQAIDAFRISLARTSIENAYKEKNYPYAHVDVPPDPLAERGDLIFQIVEGPRIRIRKVDIKGVRSFTKDKVKDQVKTSSWIFIFRPGRYDPDQIDEDVASIRKFYQDKGFFDVRVGRKLIVSPDQSEMEVEFVVDEGRRYSIERVAFEGNSKVSEAQLRQGLKMIEGQAYDNEIVQRDVRQIVKDYSPFGFIYQPQASDEDYLRIDTKPVFLKEAGRVELVYQIHEGKPFRIGNIYVKGNDKSQQKLALREFRNFAPGALFNSFEMQEAQDRLRAQPYFSSVNITPIGEDRDVRDVLVEVQENRTASFTVGAGVNSNGGVGGNITYEQRNFDISNIPNDWRDIISEHGFTGGGQDFRASFEPGTIQTNASVRFTEPWLFDQPYSFSEELYLRDRVREHYDDRRLGDRISFGKRFNYEWSGLLSLRGERVKIGQIEDQKYRAPEILEAEGHSILTSAGVQVRRDTTNPGFFPYKGTVTSAGVEGYGLLGGDYDFQKFTLEWSGYKTLYEDLIDRRTVLALHGYAGFITGRSIFFERFYGGGIGSLRGFQFRGVSPRSGRGNDPVGGDFVATGTAEVNFPIYGDSFRGVFFTDFGDVESTAKLGTIRTSAGFGVRVTLPFLGQTPIAVDFGFPITKSHQDDTQLISFSFGFTQ